MEFSVLFGNRWPEIGFFLCPKIRLHFVGNFSLGLPFHACFPPHRQCGEYEWGPMEWMLKMEVEALQAVGGKSGSADVDEGKAG